MKGALARFAALEAVTPEEAEIMATVEKDLRHEPRSWEFFCGIQEGVELITRMYPFARADLTFRCVIRVVAIINARLALEAIQEAEDLESFPEELE